MAYQKQKDYIGTKYDLGPYVLHSFTSELNENINHITSLCLRANRKENRPHIEYQEYKPQKAKNNPPTK